MIKNTCKVYIVWIATLMMRESKRMRLRVQERMSGIKNSREQIHHQVNDRSNGVISHPISRFTSHDTPPRPSLPSSVSPQRCGRRDKRTDSQTVGCLSTCICARFSSRILSFSLTWTIKRLRGFLKGFNCRSGTRSNINYQHFTKREFSSSSSSSLCAEEIAPI